MRSAICFCYSSIAAVSGGVVPYDVSGWLTADPAPNVVLTDTVLFTKHFA